MTKGRKKTKIPPNNEFAKRVDASIGERTNKQISELAGIGEGQIGYYRKGRIPLTITIQQFEALCKALNLTSDELLFGKKIETNGAKFVKISCEIIKTNGIRQMLFTVTPTRESPPECEERRKKSEIYIDLP